MQVSVQIIDYLLGNKNYVKIITMLKRLVIF